LVLRGGTWSVGGTGMVSVYDHDGSATQHGPGATVADLPV